MALITKLQDKVVWFCTFLFLALAILYSIIIGWFVSISDGLIANNPMRCWYSTAQIAEMDKYNHILSDLALNGTAFEIIAKRENHTDMTFECTSLHTEEDCVSVGCSWVKLNEARLLNYVPAISRFGGILFLALFAIFNKQFTPANSPQVVTIKFVWIMSLTSISVNLICAIIFLEIKTFASAVSALVLNCFFSFTSMLPLIVCFIRTNIRASIRGLVLFLISSIQYLSTICALLVEFWELDVFIYATDGRADKHIRILIKIGLGLLTTVLVMTAAIHKMKNRDMELLEEQVAITDPPADTASLPEDTETSDMGGNDDESPTSVSVAILQGDNTSQSRLLMEEPELHERTRNFRKATRKQTKMFVRRIRFLPVLLIMITCFIRSGDKLMNEELFRYVAEEEKFIVDERTTAHILLISFRFASILCLYFSVAGSDSSNFEPQGRFNRLTAFTLYTSIVSWLIFYNMNVSSLATYIYFLYFLFGTSWNELSTLATTETMQPDDHLAPYVVTFISVVGAIGSIVGLEVWDAIQTKHTALETLAGSATVSFVTCGLAAMINSRKMRKMNRLG